MIRRTHHHARAFTLLEILLATAVMSVIALSIYSAVQIALKARNSAVAAVTPARSAELAMSAISEDLESALWPTGTLAGTFTSAAGSEVSSTDQIEFYAVLPPNHTAAAAMSDPTLSSNGSSNLIGAIDPTYYAGVCRVDILVRQLPTDTQPVLVRRITRNLLSTTDPPTEDQVLCRGVRAFTASYVDGQQNFYDSWDSTQQGDALPLYAILKLQLEPSATADATASGADNVYETTRFVTLACYRDTSQGAAP